MLITPHAATGAALVILIPHEEIAFPAALASHLILDSIPHWDFTPDFRHLYKLLPDGITAIGAVSVMVWLSGLQWQLVATGSLLAILPDLIQQLEHFGTYSWLRPFFTLHNKIQRRAGVLPGLMVQLALVLVCFLIAA